MESPPLVIRWNETESPRYQWFIRRLHPDGSFHGEVRSTFDAPRDSDGAAGVGRSIEGNLSAEDMQRVSELAAHIRRSPTPLTDAAVIGVLAEGPVANPTVLYRHPNSSESDNAKCFLEIIAILRPHLAHHYPSLE